MFTVLRPEIFIGHTFPFRGINTLPCAYFSKECIFYGDLGLGVYRCVHVHSAPQASSHSAKYSK